MTTIKTDNDRLKELLEINKMTRKCLALKIIELENQVKTVTAAANGHQMRWKNLAEDSSLKDSEFLLLKSELKNVMRRVELSERSTLKEQGAKELLLGIIRDELFRG